jgi:hypothetical protein
LITPAHGTELIAYKNNRFNLEELMEINGQDRQGP